MNLNYARMGGHPPQNDELLEISPKGSYKLRRVVGLNRVGQFAGNLPAEGAAEMRQRIEAAEDESSPDAGPERPQRVHETLQSGKHEWDVFPEWEDAGPLGKLAAFARSLSEELTDEPDAALAFSLSDDAGQASLRALGDSRLSVDFTGATAEYSLFGEDQDFIDSGALTLALAPGPQELPLGWSADLDIPSKLDFNPERTLQARFSFRMKYSDGIWRDAQITAVAGKGWF